MDSKTEERFALKDSLICNLENIIFKEHREAVRWSFFNIRLRLFRNKKKYTKEFLLCSSSYLFLLNNSCFSLKYRLLSLTESAIFFLCLKTDWDTRKIKSFYSFISSIMLVRVEYLEYLNPSYSGIRIEGQSTGFFGLFNVFLFQNKVNRKHLWLNQEFNKGVES